MVGAPRLTLLGVINLHNCYKWALHQGGCRGDRLCYFGDDVQAG